VPLTELGKQIIKKSFETKRSISSHDDGPKEDQTKQRTLVEELKRRKANVKAGFDNS